MHRHVLATSLKMCQKIIKKIGFVSSRYTSDMILYININFENVGFYCKRIFMILNLMTKLHFKVKMKVSFAF